MLEADQQIAWELRFFLVLTRNFVESSKPMKPKRELNTAPPTEIPGPMELKPSMIHDPNFESSRRSGDAPRAGALIVNADDWGLNQENTRRILECLIRGAVSSVSAMVFMQDSERAAAIAQERSVDAGLHLNFTSPFSAPGSSRLLLNHLNRISHYLLRYRYAQVLFHPGLAQSFDYVVSAQLDEFQRIYGELPNRIDGHHHMHLCANVILRKLMPSGTTVRRNFSFQKGERGLCNRMYRGVIDGILRRHHQLSDFFFSMPPLEPLDRLQRIFSLARHFVVEVGTHPANLEEYRFLTEGGIFKLAGDVQVSSRYALRKGELSPDASSLGDDRSRFLR